jgi:hypothetical protein
MLPVKLSYCNANLNDSRGHKKMILVSNTTVEQSTGSERDSGNEIKIVDDPPQSWSGIIRNASITTH